MKLDQEKSKKGDQKVEKKEPKLIVEMLKFEQEEKKGDCTDCLKPMGDADEHLRKNHRDLFISCKLCLQVGIQTFFF